MKYTSGDVLVGSRREGAPSMRRKLARRRPFHQCFYLPSLLKRPRTSATTTSSYSSSFAPITYRLFNLLAWASPLSPTHSPHLLEPQPCLTVPARFWGQPIRYLRWASHEKPAIFWSCVLGSFGPVALFGLPPLRRYFGDEDPSLIPHTYPGESLIS